MQLLRVSGDLWGESHIRLVRRQHMRPHIFELQNRVRCALPRLSAPQLQAVAEICDWLAHQQTQVLFLCSCQSVCAETPRMPKPTEPLVLLAPESRAETVNKPTEQEWEYYERVARELIWRMSSPMPTPLPRSGCAQAPRICLSALRAVGACARRMLGLVKTLATRPHPPKQRMPQ